jgi:subtilisin family serine protease
MILFLLACAPAPEVVDAGEPSAQESYDPASDAFYSDLFDDGWDNVPGRYNVLLADRGELLGVYRGFPELFPEVEFENVPAFTATLTYDEALDLASDPRVLAVEPDWIAWANAGKPSSACATSTSQTTPTGVSVAGSNAATGTGVKVAVIDSGIYLHSDLAIAGFVDKVSGKATAYDDNGHGTHVSGTVAAINNSGGVVGVAPGASLYGVKVLDRRGSGAYSTVASGVDWTVSNGMNVANLSLGGPTDSATLHASITAAKAANVVVVVAAGNEGVNAGTSYPAAYDGEVITVSAYDTTTSSFASWSNYGSVVDVAAQGVDVCSTSKSGSYEKKSGTSMAAPHVAGAVAVYLQNNPGATFATVEAAIEANVSTLTDTATHTEDLSTITGM